MDTPSQNATNAPTDDGLPLREWLADMGAVVRRHPLAALAGIGAGLLLTLLMFQVTTFRYETELVVAPAQQDSGLSRNLAGLASIAGVNLSKGQAVSPFALYLEMLRGSTVARAVQQDEALMRRLYPGRFDAAAGQWHPSRSPLAIAARFGTSVLGLDYVWPARPRVADVQRFLNDKVAVSEDRRDSIVRINFADADPDLAAALVWKMHSAADGVLRQKALRRADSYIAFLNDRLPGIQIVELRLALSQVLADQMKERMAAQSGLPYSAEPVGAISISPRPTRPNPASLLAAGLVVSVLMGIGSAYLVRCFGGRRAPAE